MMPDWEDFAASLSSGEIVGVANIIANRGAHYVTVEACARAVIPAVVALLIDSGYRIRRAP